MRRHTGTAFEGIPRNCEMNILNSQKYDSLRRKYAHQSSTSHLDPTVSDAIEGDGERWVAFVRGPSGFGRGQLATRNTFHFSFNTYFLRQHDYHGQSSTIPAYRLRVVNYCLCSDVHFRRIYIVANHVLSCIEPDLLFCSAGSPVCDPWKTPSIRRSEAHLCVYKDAEGRGWSLRRCA